jgi:hypothetical protein
MSYHDTTADPATATFTVVSASTGKVYACGVNAGTAAGWMEPYGGRRDELLALELFDFWRAFPDTRGIAVMRIT